MIEKATITLPLAHRGQKITIKNDNDYPIEILALPKEEIEIRKDSDGRDYFAAKRKSKWRRFWQFFGLLKDKPVWIFPDAPQA